MNLSLSHPIRSLRGRHPPTKSCATTRAVGLAHLVLAMATLTFLNGQEAEPLGPCTRRTPLVISEIMYHPPARPDGNDLQFIEVYNSQPWFSDLSGFKLAGDIAFTFRNRLHLPVGHAHATRDLETGGHPAGARQVVARQPGVGAAADTPLPRGLRSLDRAGEPGHTRPAQQSRLG
jgi:hypothetical protein